MKKKYKAIIIDLDGTTVPNRRDGMPSEQVKDAIMKAHEKVFVCVATGRPLHDAEKVLDVLKITNPVILLGGSQIIDGGSKKYIYQRPLLLHDAQELFERFKPYYGQLIVDEKERIRENFENYEPKEAFNFLIKHLSEQEADAIINDISDIKTISAHKIISWEKGEIVLNISHIEATKQHAIFEVAKRLNIETHEIIGVGDGYNDFPLLMASGLKVAMGNAVEELKAIADYIAPSIEEDGLADVIEKFIL